MENGIIEFADVWKVYSLGVVQVEALRRVSFVLGRGEHLAIMGPSGSGKTTLLNLLGCLDRPSRGRYLMEGRDISTLDDDGLSEIRRRKIGFVFQSYNLIPQLTVLENIGLPLFYQGVEEAEIERKARQYAGLVGLHGRLDHRPTELSGGQQQRVAIARALVHEPILILADEPTGNLDSATGTEIMALLDGLNREGITLIVVTHDPGIGAHAVRIIRLLDGEIRP